ncbi:MAG: DEAD/DEAH box helicase family protein [Candidatus Cloacimonetes bacterium]|nr:DEAD/DEAH box helicase family protein [Candidatus Cloacimonadota bacterium]
MKQLTYQQKAIAKIVNHSVDFLNDSDPQTIIFQAPTGSGKTTMMAESMIRIVKELQSKEALSFVWISVNNLHRQSSESLELHFENDRLLECVEARDIVGNVLEENQILFINWQSLNREGNLFMVDNEDDWNLSKIISNTKDEGRKIVLIIDESHHSAKTSKAKEVLSIIEPDLTIEMSATPKDISGLPIKIKIEDVVAEGMIKKEVKINYGLKKDFVKNNEDIVNVALQKRKQLKASYEKLGLKINPLLLIQIPDAKKGQRPPEEKIIDVLSKFGITKDAGKLGIYLNQEDKDHLFNVRENTSEIEVLIFKDAIALGWDCPRASILLLQKEWNSENYEFNVQTLGRIMRMPEQKHYESCEDLNFGYVFTASDNFTIVEDVAKDYASSATMLRDNTKYRNIDLPSAQIRRKREITRLQAPFKKCLFDSAEELNTKKKLVTSIATYKKAVGVGGSAKTIDEKRKDIDFKSEIEIEKNREEVFDSYNRFLESCTVPYAKSDSTNTLKSHLRSLFITLFKIDDEDQIANIVIREKNKTEIEELIDLAKTKYANLPTQQDTIVENNNWQIPEDISVFNDFEEQVDIQKSIMSPYYLKKDKNSRLTISKPENKFVSKLESSEDYLVWWFKNGERESKFFGIPYKKQNPKSGEDALYGFYPDFILRTKKETIIVEIKDDKDFKNENLLKLNAGKAYVEKYKGKDNILFFILSPRDYINFFHSLNEQSLDTFSSKYEYDLIRFSQSRKVVSKATKAENKEDQELLDLYEEELNQAIKKIKDIETEKEILKIDLDNAKLMLKEESSVLEDQDVKLPKPFNICIIGETVDDDLILKDVRKYFIKYGLGTNDWDIQFISNSKLKSSDVFSGLKRGQSKYGLIITAQIYHHSAKGNESANILTELKKPKYIDHIVGSSPKDKLSTKDMLSALEKYISKFN